MRLIIIAAVSCASHVAYAQPLPDLLGPPSLPPAWSGLYAGASVGASFGYSALSTRPLLAGPGADLRSEGQGAIGGAFAGFSQQAGSFVLGAEADFSALSARDGLTDIDPGIGAGQATSQATWLATVRGRIGFLLAPSAMLYGTAGIAIAGLKASQNYALYSPAGPFIYQSRGTGSSSGWVAGGGGEYAITRNVVLRAEYLYVDLDVPSMNEGSDFSGVYAWDPSFSLVRVGASWRF